MIRLLCSYLILLLFSASALKAQPLASFASPISEAKVVKKDPVPLSLNDFRPSAYEQSYQLKSAFKPIQIAQTKPGMAFLYSAAVPGLGQAANRKWGRAAMYLAVEAFGIFYHFDQLDKARTREARYEQYANENWSVVAYSQWLINYHDANGLTNPNLAALRAQVAGIEPAFNFNTDRQFVDIDLLNSIERNTPFLFNNGRLGSNFSHILPDYGSQQYYELISKYFQFQSGWRDFYEMNTTDPNHQYLYAWNGDDATEQFFLGVDRARQFNDNYRAAGNIVTLIILNHVISAFDAYFTVKLQNSRLQADLNLINNEQLTLRYSF